MKRYVLITLVLVSGIYFLGCGQKQQPLEEMQAPMSIESLGTVSTETKASEVKNTPLQTMPEAAAPQLAVLPPAGPYKPTTQEIQTALKNAGYYIGVVDGKKGPMTKKAIEDFQKANSLEADGKVGSKTWAVLEKYLNITVQEPKAKR